MPSYGRPCQNHTFFSGEAQGQFCERIRHKMQKLLYKRWEAGTSCFCNKTGGESAAFCNKMGGER